MDNDDCDDRARLVAVYALSALGFVVLGVALGFVLDWITHR